jgi:hypothetical protein
VHMPTKSLTLFCTAVLVQNTMGIDCRRGVSPYPDIGSGLSLAVDPAYTNSLGSQSALADCYLTSEEIATDPEAAALAASFIAETAAQLGVDPGDVDITGISLDNDNIPGCAPGYELGGSPHLRAITVSLDDAFTGRLGNEMARLDCTLTPAEIASDPTLARIARGFTGSICSMMQMGGRTDECIGDITVTQIKLVGCGGANTAPDVTVQVPEAFSNALASVSAYDDCTITYSELSPTGQDFVSQVIQSEANVLGVPTSQVSLESISVDGDSTAGCNQNAGLQGGFGVTLNPDYLASLGDTNGGLADGTLTPEEIAADADAAALAEEFRLTVCASLGLVDCSQVQIDGIDVVGRRRMESGEGELVTVQPTWKFTNGDVMLRVKLTTV